MIIKACFVLIFIPILANAKSKEKNSVKLRTLTAVDDDGSDYDSHGCCLTCGQFYCHSSSKCVSDWDTCNLGHYDSSKCQFRYNNSIHGFTFDLSSYAQLSNSFYEITDEFSHTSQTFKYYFNLCQNVKSKLLPSACSSTSGSGGDICGTDALAYQYFLADWGYEACYRLSTCQTSGSTAEKSASIELGLLDPVEPASGIYVKYSGGDTCPNSYSDKASCDKKVGYTEYCSRSFTLNIKCHDEIKRIPENEKVVENAGCAYEATINHRMGCPLECPRNSKTHQICSGQGLCFYAGYDDGLTSSDKIDRVGLSCLCNSGFTGSSCDTQLGYLYSYSSSNGSTQSTWLLIILVFLAILGTGMLLSRNLGKFVATVTGDDSEIPLLRVFRQSEKISPI